MGIWRLTLPLEQESWPRAMSTTFSNNIFKQFSSLILSQYSKCTFILAKSCIINADTWSGCHNRHVSPKVSLGSMRCLISSTFSVSRYSIGVGSWVQVCCFDVAISIHWDIRPEVRAMSSQAESCAIVLASYFRSIFATNDKAGVIVANQFLYDAT